jgi:hypothetical protein
MNSLDELYQRVKIDWTDFLIECDDCQNDSGIEFELMPEDYLEFAKNNIKSHDIQNGIEGISNAKRAIECQVDLLIKSIGYDFKIFDKRRSYPEVKKFINQYYSEEQYDGLTDRLKLLNILGLAPTMVISHVREMRNLIEHEYKIPSFNDVKNAVEIADLFINSSNRKFSDAPTIMDIGNKIKTNGKLIKCFEIDIPYIKIYFSNRRSADTVEIYFMESKKDNDFDDYTHLNLKPEDKNYIETIYCMLNKGYNVLPYIFGCDINPKHIRYEMIE